LALLIALSLSLTACGGKKSGFTTQAVVIEGGQKVVYASQLPLDLEKPFSFAVPPDDGGPAFVYKNAGKCTCFSTEDTTGDVDCQTGAKAKPEPNYVGLPANLQDFTWRSETFPLPSCNTSVGDRYAAAAED